MQLPYVMPFCFVFTLCERFGLMEYEQESQNSHEVVYHHVIDFVEYFAKSLIVDLHIMMYCNLYIYSN